MFRTIVLVGFVLASAASAWSAEFTVIAWNVESDFPGGSSDPHDGTDPPTIASQLGQTGSTDFRPIVRGVAMWPPRPNVGAAKPQEANRSLHRPCNCRDVASN